MSTTPFRLDNLDLLRGITAFLVLAGHLRASAFQSYATLQETGIPSSVPVEEAFYFMTGLGHQAVIVFFALSGFLVGGKALRDILAGRFSWRCYLLRRLTRLWIVIIPALLLTLLLDDAGLSLTLGKGYDGRYHDLYASGAYNPDGVDHSIVTFLDNLAFLKRSQYRSSVAIVRCGAWQMSWSAYFRSSCGCHWATPIISKALGTPHSSIAHDFPANLATRRRHDLGCRCRSRMVRTPAGVRKVPEQLFLRIAS